MKKKPFPIYKLGASLVLTSMGASAWAFTHVVSRGETLSEIASRYIPGRVYGTRGSLAKIAGLNPEITNVDKIRVGQKLRISTDEIQGLANNEASLVERSPAEEQDVEASLADPAAPLASDTEFSRFELSAKFLQSRLAATDSSTSGKSIMGSSFSPEFGIRWGQHWESGFQSYLETHLRRESFQTTSSTQTLSENTLLLYGFSLGARLLPFGGSGALEASLHLDQESFIRAKSVSEITVDSVLVPKARLLMRTDLVSSRVFRLSSELSASYLAPVSTASYSTKSGYGVGTALLLHHDRAKRPFFGGLSFDYMAQNTSITSQNYMSVGLRFGLSFDVQGEGN